MFDYRLLPFSRRRSGSEIAVENAYKYRRPKKHKGNMIPANHIVMADGVGGFLDTGLIGDGAGNLFIPLNGSIFGTSPDGTFNMLTVEAGGADVKLSGVGGGVVISGQCQIQADTQIDGQIQGTDLAVAGALGDGTYSFITAVKTITILNGVISQILGT